MKPLRLLLTISICLFNLFPSHQVYCQTPNDGVSIWATTGPNYSIIKKSDLIDNYLGVSITPKPGWHAGVGLFIPFKLPKTKSKLFLNSSFELTQIKFQFEQSSVPNSNKVSNSHIFTANIGLGKYFQFSDKFGMRFSINQALYTYKVNQDSNENRITGSNSWAVASVFNIRKRRVSLGISGFIGPLFIFDNYYDTWCIGKLKGGQCLENKFRALQLDVGIQLWNDKK